jgi:tRNA-splicing ligase RtcB
MSIKKVLGEGRWPVKIWTNEVEPSAEQQLRNLAELPFIHKHVAAMPDVHAGFGSTAGSVIATKGAIIPAAVGVDIGCGMVALKLPLKGRDLPSNLHAIRSDIETAVPHGRSDNGGVNDKGAWGIQAIPTLVHAYFGAEPEGRRTDFGNASQSLTARLWRLQEEFPKLHRSASRAINQLGTLGTGNHFIELCLDLEDNVWIMLHSGSRGIGNAIGTYFIERAKKDMERWFVHLPDKDLAYLPDGSENFNHYMKAVAWAQDYAMTNRTLMLRAVVQVMQKHFPERLGEDSDYEMLPMAINCHHNYVARENHFGLNVWITRKGAVRARAGDLGIIPGSMGARSFIVRGKGNPDSFDSCSHGAGRKMSRTAARAQFTVQDLEAQTFGIECRKDAEVIDEIPGAYKDIQQVMDNQSDLVEVVTELHQIICVKG